MLPSEIYASSPASTFQLDVSAMHTSQGEEKHIAIDHMTCPRDQNLNLNATDHCRNLMKSRSYLCRVTRSSDNMAIHDLYSSINQEKIRRNNKPSRVESAVITSNEHSHCLIYSVIHESGPRIDMSMNRTIDSIQRNGAGDENAASHFNSKQMNTSITKDNHHYLSLELVSAQNRQTIQWTSKQVILFSVSLLVFAVLLCCTVIFIIF